MILEMSYFSMRLKAHLASSEVDLSVYRLAHLMGVHKDHLYKFTVSGKRPTDEILEKMASVPEAKLTLDKLRSWRAVDDYGIEALKLAVEDYQP